MANSKKKHQKANEIFDLWISKKEEINGEKVRVHSHDYCYAKVAESMFWTTNYAKAVLNGWSKKK